MADQKLSARSITTIVTGGFVHIILPAATPSGFASWRIAIDDLIGSTKERHAAQAANFTIDLDADTLLTSIDLLFVTGTPVIKVGTALSTNDIISGRTLSVSKNSLNILRDYFKNATTLYFTITGGTVDVLVNYKKDYNS